MITFLTGAPRQNKFRFVSPWESGLTSYLKLPYLTWKSYFHIPFGCYRVYLFVISYGTLRKKICFQGKTLNVGAIVCEVWNLIEDHKAMFNILHMEDDNPQSASPPIWSLPLDNFYKINVGVADPEDGVWRFGTIIWDDECVVLPAVTWKITILPNVDVVEAMSFRLALQFIVNLSFRCIMIEWVSINVVRVINAYFF